MPDIKPDYDFMEKTYQTAISCGLEIIPTDTAARILAVVCVHGNNEFLTHCPKFAIEARYMQKRFGIHGCGIPDKDIIAPLRAYVAELEKYLDEHPKDRYPGWAKELFLERYGMKLIN